MFSSQLVYFTIRSIYLLIEIVGISSFSNIFKLNIELFNLEVLFSINFSNNDDMKRIFPFNSSFIISSLNSFNSSKSISNAVVEFSLLNDTFNLSSWNEFCSEYMNDILNYFYCVFFYQ